MLQKTSTILTALAFTSFLGGQDEKGFETRRYDIRAISAALSEKSAGFPFTSSPNRPGGAGEASVRYLWGERESASDGGDAVAKLVGFALLSDPEYEGRRDLVHGSDGWLRVEGPARIHAQVPRILAEIGRVALQTCEVELAIVPSEALTATSGAVLDAGKVDRLLEVAKPLATMRTQVRPGSETLFEAVARRAFVKDYDTEVAMDAKVADPLVDVIPEGTRVGVRVDSLPRGGFIVTVRGQQAEPNGMPRVQTLSYPLPASLQLPRVWWTSTSASAKVEDRGALVIGNDATPRAVWVVRVFAKPAPEAPANPPVHLVRIGVITSEPLETQCPVFFSPNPGGVGAGLSGEPAGRSENRHRLAPDVLRDELDALREAGAAQDPRRARVIGSLAVLDGDEKFVAAAKDLLGKVSDDLTHGYSIDVRFGTLPAGGVTMPASDELETLAATLSNHAMSAALAGDRVVILGGEAHSYLKDRDVEIAQGVSTDDPIVDVFFTGLSMSLQVLPAGEGRCSVDVRLGYQELLELASITTGSKEVPEIELPRIAAVQASVPIDVALGTWTLVHRAPLEGTDRQIIVIMRVLAA